MGLRPDKRFRCCGKIVCHCTETNDNAAQNEKVVNGRGKEINPDKLRRRPRF